MTKSEIIGMLAKKTRLSKTSCEAVIDTFADEIKNALINGERVNISGLMTFEVSERKERLGRNPKTGEVEKFPATKSVKCKISKNIKDAVNGKSE